MSKRKLLPALVVLLLAMTAFVLILVKQVHADEATTARRMSLSSPMFEGFLLLPKSCAEAIEQVDPLVIYFECEFPAGTGKFWAGIDDRTRMKDTEGIGSFLENFKPRLGLSTAYSLQNGSGSIGGQGGYHIGRAFGSVINRDLGPYGTITHRYAAKFYPRFGSDSRTGFLFGLMQLQKPIEIQLAGAGTPPEIPKRFVGFEDIIKNFAIVDSEDDHSRSFGNQFN
jgi:hypothetical protein